MTRNLVRTETAMPGVTRIVLARPEKRNALTRGLLEELTAAVDTAQQDQAVRLLLLEADGPVFCAGMDLGEMQQRAAESNSAEEWARDTRVYRDLLEKLFRLPIPTVAVAQGSAIAGGMGLVLACDIVLAAEGARFALPEPKRGISAAVVTPFLVHRIGAGNAGYLLMSGRAISAECAMRFGLCHEITAPERLTECRDELVNSILTGSRTALAVTKQNLIDASATAIGKQLDAGMQISATARETDDAREGLAAFLEKREPNWSP